MEFQFILRGKMYRIIFLFLCTYLCLAYKVPYANIEILKPKGFKVSIPAQNGDTLFAFHGNLNKRIMSSELGQWSVEIVEVENKRFTFSDRKTNLKVGDTMYYWTYVVNNGFGYKREGGMFKVTENGVHTPDDFSNNTLIQIKIPKNNRETRSIEINRKRSRYLSYKQRFETI